MSLSFFAVIVAIRRLDYNNIKEAFEEQAPVKFLGNFQIFVGVMVGLMWLARIKPSFSGGVPIGLEHYTTLVIQALDFGFFIPLAILSGIMIKKRSNLGYLLTPIIIVKAVLLGLSILAMSIGQAIANVNVSFVETAIFILINIIMLFSFVILMKNIKAEKV